MFTSRSLFASQKKDNKKRWLRVTGIFFLFLLIGSVYNSLTSTVDTMHEPIVREKSEKRTKEVTIAKKEALSVLMLGVDEREGDKGRSDTMIVLTVNPNNNSVKMSSIPRDIRTEIIGRGKKDKINHAFAYGGVEMAMDTVELLRYSNRLLYSS